MTLGPKTVFQCHTKILHCPEKALSDFPSDSGLDVPPSPRQNQSIRQCSSATGDRTARLLPKCTRPRAPHGAKRQA